ncbi:MAG: AEC family transporter [Ruminococcaceae bacterium]|nr:AEC family transporter [Oscillospiraceae bacterium]
MLDSFVFSLNATLPVFLVIVVGKILNKCGLFTKEFAFLTDKFVFKAALPVLLFKDISEMDFRQDFDVKFVLFCVSVSFVMFLGVWGLSYLFLKDKAAVGAFSQGAARGSAAILGIALATNIYGSSGYAPLMVLAAVPVFNVMSVIILELSRKNGNGRVNVASILKGIITNPIILGIIAGVPFSLFDISLPTFAAATVDSVAKTATPMALLSVGAAFSFGEAKKKLTPSLVASFVKLFALPLVFLPLAIAFGFRDSALVSIFILLGSPTTVTSYVMAKNMDNDGVLASNIVMLATLFSALSITLWVFVLKQLSLI